MILNKRQQFADIKQFIRHLTFNKSFNLIKSVVHFYGARIFKLNFWQHLPFHYSIEPTTTCNLKCPECPSGLRSFTRPTGTLNESVFQQFLTQTEQSAVYYYFYFQGEPFLHPKFLSLVEHANKANIYTVTSTNAHYLSKKTCKNIIKSGLSRIIISIDGVTQQTYGQYRKGGRLSKVLEGTQNLVEARNESESSLYIIWQFLVVRPNEHEIDQLHQLGKSYGVDEIKLKTAQIYDYQNGNDLIPLQNQYARYKKWKNDQYYIKNKLKNKCWKLWSSTVMTWDGDILPCCFDKDGKYVMGNISTASFKDIWQATSYQNFRSQLLTNRAEIDICKNCTEGLTVWAN